MTHNAQQFHPASVPFTACAVEHDPSYEANAICDRLHYAHRGAVQALDELARALVEVHRVTGPNDAYGIAGAIVPPDRPSWFDRSHGDALLVRAADIRGQLNALISIAEDRA